MPEARPQREVPPPLEGNDVMITLTGSVAWAVALVVLLLLRDQLPAGSRWWIWTCLAGLGIGLFALLYVPSLKRSRARAAAHREGKQAPPPGRAGSEE
jgi:drug/metabolite transporter (DMT)-like permease